MSVSNGPKFATSIGVKFPAEVTEASRDRLERITQGTLSEAQSPERLLTEELGEPLKALVPLKM
jgi:hypothetical protein